MNSVTGTIKVSLHIHSNEDSEDGNIIRYSLFELVDFAQANHIKVLASTAHDLNVATQKHIDYAKSKGVLLLSGIELDIDGQHVLVINCGSSADDITTYEQLREFKARNPKVFIIAAHPAHGVKSIRSLKQLEINLDCFDAIEHSWFYIRCFNPNNRAKGLAQKNSLPFIATADAHIFKYLTIDYAEVSCSEINAEAIFASIRRGDFINHTRFKTVFEVSSFILWMYYRKLLMKYFK